MNNDFPIFSFLFAVMVGFFGSALLFAINSGSPESTQRDSILVAWHQINPPPNSGYTQCWYAAGTDAIICEY